MGGASGARELMGDTERLAELRGRFLSPAAGGEGGIITCAVGLGEGRSSSEGDAESEHITSSITSLLVDPEPLEARRDCAPPMAFGSSASRGEADSSTHILQQAALGGHSLEATQLAARRRTHPPDATMAALAGGAYAWGLGRGHVDTGWAGREGDFKEGLWEHPRAGSLEGLRERGLLAASQHSPSSVGVSVGHDSERRDLVSDEDGSQTLEEEDEWDMPSRAGDSQDLAHLSRATSMMLHLSSSTMP